MRVYTSMSIGAVALAWLVSPAALRGQTDTTVLVRAAMSGVATYHFLEAFQTRGSLVLPDFGYVDFGKSNYREVFGGGGAIVHSGKYLTWIQEAYLDQALGPAAKSAICLVPWSLVAWRVPRSKVSGETVYFTYLPLNHDARIQYVLDRAKAEYSLGRVKVGAGYAAYRFADTPWQQKPFVTATIESKRMGSCELWLQRVPGRGVQVHLRLARTWRKEKDRS